jgi:hypothetical protein
MKRSWTSSLETSGKTGTTAVELVKKGVDALTLFDRELQGTPIFLLEELVRSQKY